MQNETESKLLVTRPHHLVSSSIQARQCAAPRHCGTPYHHRGATRAMARPARLLAACPDADGRQRAGLTSRRRRSPHRPMAARDANIEGPSRPRRTITATTSFARARGHTRRWRRPRHRGHDHDRSAHHEYLRHDATATSLATSTRPPALPGAPARSGALARWGSPARRRYGPGQILPTHLRLWRCMHGSRNGTAFARRHWPPRTIGAERRQR